MANLTAAKFQAATWANSMRACFREDYTEHRQLNGTGMPIVIQRSEADSKP